VAYKIVSNDKNNANLQKKVKRDLSKYYFSKIDQMIYTKQF